MVEPRANEGVAGEAPFAPEDEPKWRFVESIAESDAFQKSTRLPALLRYLARHTLLGDQRMLSEQMIGQAVFGKRHHFDPAEDSSVRVNVRQLRMKLHEYFQAAPQGQSTWLVTIPKGGYALDFEPIATEPIRQETSKPAAEVAPAARVNPLLFFQIACAVLAVAMSILGIAWYRATRTHVQPVPWPFSVVISPDAVTNVILADAGTSLRMLGDQEVPLDSYINRTNVLPLIKNATPDEANLFQYLASTRLTSLADADAAAVIASAPGNLSDKIIIRSARDVNSTDLAHGNFIFVGSRTSNPWVELAEQQMNFQLVENGTYGSRYFLNQHPTAKEQTIYQPSALGTLASGDDYAVIAIVPAKTGTGAWLILEGVRMEGTTAAVSLLKTESGRMKLLEAVAAKTGGKPPKYFEALLHAQSVAGQPMNVEVTATRVMR